MERHPLKAVIFDLDGTLLDRNTSLAAFARAQYRKLASRLTPATAEDFFRRFLELDNHGAVWKDEVYQRLILEFEITKIGWEGLLQDYVANFRRYCVALPGVHEALAALAGSGYKLAIISNGRYPFQLHSVEALGIVSMFEFVMVSEQEGVRKPDPEIFRRALARLGVKASEAVYVGDHPETDVQAAKHAGLKAIWHPSVQSPECTEADGVCADFRELHDIIHGIR